MSKWVKTKDAWGEPIHRMTVEDSCDVIEVSGSDWDISVDKIHAYGEERTLKAAKSKAEAVYKALKSL